MTESPADLPGVDPEEFVGEPPTGEADPEGFTSGDQSSEEPSADRSEDDS